MASSMKMARGSDFFVSVDPPNADTIDADSSTAEGVAVAFAFDFDFDFAGAVADAVAFSSMAAFTIVVEDFLGGITVMKGAMFRLLSTFTSDNRQRKGCYRRLRQITDSEKAVTDYFLLSHSPKHFSLASRLCLAHSNSCRAEIIDSLADTIIVF